MRLLSDLSPPTAASVCVWREPTWGWAGLGWAGSLPLNQLQDCAASSRTTVSQGNQRQLGQKLGCLGLT